MAAHFLPSITEFVNSITGLITVLAGIYIAFHQHKISKKIDKIDDKMNGNGS